MNHCRKWHESLHCCSTSAQCSIVSRKKQFIILCKSIGIILFFWIALSHIWLGGLPVDFQIFAFWNINVFNYLFHCSNSEMLGCANGTSKAQKLLGLFSFFKPHTQPPKWVWNARFKFLWRGSSNLQRVASVTLWFFWCKPPQTPCLFHERAQTSCHAGVTLNRA